MIPQIDFLPLIEKQKNVAFRNTREADSYFSDCVNAIYDTYDAICELDTDIKKLPTDQVQTTLIYLEQIKPLVTQFLDLLADMDFDCKNHDRLNSMLSDLEKDLPGAITKLQKMAKQD